MSVLVDALRTASRMRRYARLRRQHGGSTKGDVARAVLYWGIAALAPALAALAAAMGRDGRLIDVSLALLLTAAVAHVLGKPRMPAFDLLYQPSRRGLVLGHVLYRAPFYAWAGLLSATAWWIAMPWLPGRVGGSLALGAVALAPLAFGVNAGATRVAGRAGSEESAWMLPFILPVVAYQVADLWLDAPAWRWLLPAVACIAGFVIVARAHVLVTAARKCCALLFLVAVLAIPAAPRGPAFVDDSAIWIAVGVTMALACVAVLLLSLRTQLLRVGFAEVVSTHVAAEGEMAPSPKAAELAPAPRATTSSTRVGEGLWRAQLRYTADAWLPSREPDTGWRGVVSQCSSMSMILLVTILRGPILGATAVLIATEDTTAVCCAVLAGCLAGRWTAVDSMELQPRLWLLGVDYREQVLHGLRALGAFGALPTLGVAALTLALAGPGDEGRQVTVAVVAAAFLVRAGLPGLWPLQETHRARLVAIWGVQLAALTAVAFRTHSWWWPARDALQVAGIAAGVGLALLLVRLWRLREPHLRDRVRTSIEP